MMWKPVAFAIAVVVTTLFGPMYAMAHHGGGVWLESESSSSDPYMPILQALWRAFARAISNIAGNRKKAV